MLEEKYKIKIRKISLYTSESESKYGGVVRSRDVIIPNKLLYKLQMSNSKNGKARPRTNITGKASNWN